MTAFLIEGYARSASDVAALSFAQLEASPARLRRILRPLVASPRFADHWPQHHHELLH